MKTELRTFLENLGVFKVGFADPAHGFEKAKDCHPNDIMEDCKSVIVFALNAHLGSYMTLKCSERNNVELGIINVYGSLVSYKIAEFLKENNYNAVIPYGYKYEKEKIAYLSFKLAAYEAGLGVFGRSGLIITPEYGPRIYLGVVLTDSLIESDRPLKNFNPCAECDVCVRLCPINAINKELPPPTGFNRNRCLQFINNLREKTNGQIRFCGYCYNCCPAGKVHKETFRLGRWKTLLDLNDQERVKLLRTFEKS